MRRFLTLIFLTCALFAQVEGQAILPAGHFHRAVGSARTYLDVLNDGNTKGWYKAGDGSSTYMTLDGSVLTAWKDLSGNSNDLVNATGTDRPTWDGANLEIDFDGSDDYLIDATFAYSQPIILYMVVRIDAAAVNDVFTRITTSTNGQWVVPADAATKMRLWGGGSFFDTGASFFGTGTYYIFRVVWNNNVANGSKIQLNAGTAVTGTLATANATLLEIPTTTGACPQVSIKELIVRAVSESDADQTLILNYLNSTYSVY